MVPCTLPRSLRVGIAALQYRLLLTALKDFDLSFAATDAQCARGFDRIRPRSDNNAGAFELPSRREN
jgi:hypothetical protein